MMIIFFSWYFICDTLSYPGLGLQILMVTLKEPATMTLMDVSYMVDDEDPLFLHQLFSVRTLSRCHWTPVDVVTYALGPQCKAGVYFRPPSCFRLFGNTRGMDKILSINKFYTNLIFESLLHFLICTEKYKSKWWTISLCLPSQPLHKLWHYYFLYH